MIKNFAAHNNFSTYYKAFNTSVSTPSSYWQASAKQLHWFKFPKTILDDTNPPYYRWFKDGKINISYNMLDVNLQKGLGKQIAYHIQSPITGKTSQITIEQLSTRISKFSNSLIKQFNIKPLDTIIIYMPMIIQSIIAKLSSARIGAIHSVVFGGFAAHELSLRIQDANPKLIICATAGKQPNRVVDYQNIVIDAIKMSKKQNIPVIIFQRDLKKRTNYSPNFYDFKTIQQSGNPTQPPVQLQSTHPLYLLYTSGTTGSPKGIYRDHGGTAVILHHALKNIYNLNQGDGLFCTSDIGWVMGHSFITYAPLLRAVRSILFQGKPVGTPDAGIYWRIIQKCKIKHLYSSPTVMRTIRKQDPQGKLILPDHIKSLQGITLAGERCDVQTFKWVQQHFKNKFVNDTYWQTQSGSPMISNYIGLQKQPYKPGSACKPVPGYNMCIINPQTKKLSRPGETGILAMKVPTPPSFMLGLWNNPTAFKQKYFQNFQGYYQTGDSGYSDQDGYFYVMARVDDIINTAGHRLSTGQMQQCLMKHPQVAQALTIGVNDPIKGQIPVGFVTIKQGCPTNPVQLQQQLITLIRNEIGPITNFKICHIVDKLPKTRTGKYLRGILRKMYNRQQYIIPSTIQDVEVVKDLQKIVQRIHLNKENK